MDVIEKATQLKDKGKALFNNAEYLPALECFQQAIDCLKTDAASELKATLWYNVATTYFKINQFDNAKHYAMFSLNENNQLSREDFCDVDRYLLCNIMIEEHQLLEAEKFLNEIQLSQRPEKSIIMFADSYAKIASNHIKSGAFNHAQSNAAHALSLNKNIKRTHHYFASLFLLSTALLGQDKIAECEELLKVEHLTCETEQDKDFLQTSQHNLQQAKEKTASSCD